VKTGTSYTKARPPTTVLHRDQDSYRPPPRPRVTYTYYYSYYHYIILYTHACVRVLVRAVGPPADTVNVFVDIARILHVPYNNDNIILLVPARPVRGWVFFSFRLFPFPVPFLFTATRSGTPKTRRSAPHTLYGRRAWNNTHYEWRGILLFFIYLFFSFLINFRLPCKRCI
jgi:hypothetical protein